MGTFHLHRFPGPELLAGAAARDWLKEIAAADPVGRAFSTALSGGRIARTFFSMLASQAAAQGFSFQGIHFFWSDERCVPPTDPESNFRPARELLFDPLKIPQTQVHRILGEKPPEEAAAAAEAELRRMSALPHEDQPVLDLVLLGMGEDGHVASLFPGEPEAAITNRAVFRSVKAVKPPPRRITLGYPAIAAARQVWVLASGEGKAEALRQSLAPNGPTPLARVLASRPLTRIYSDCEN
jgi:6-phosphogluconolactonase